MTIRELADAASELCEEIGPQTPVVIPTMGGLRGGHVDIDALRQGFDCLDGRVTIFCKNGVVSFETFQQMRSMHKEKPQPKKQPAPGTQGKGKKRKKGKR